MFDSYYEPFFIQCLVAPYRDYEKKLEIESELRLDNNFFDNYQGRDEKNFFESIMQSVAPVVFYKSLSASCLCFTYDYRGAGGLCPEYRIKLTKYAIKKLIKDEDGRYNLSDKNKIFLKGRFNALLLFGKLLDAYYKKKGVAKKEETNIAESREFRYWVLNWCKENIKNKNSVNGGDDKFNNEVIFFLARMGAEFSIDLGGEKNADVEKIFGKILDIYKGSNNNINNITDIVNDNNNDVIKDVKDVSINFEQIQFMK